MTYADVSLLAISVASLALSYSVLLKHSPLTRRSAIVVSVAFSVLTFSFLKQNPYVLQDTVQRIVLAILAGLISLALLVKSRNP